jgi:thiosulfate/3-mercaptopyruvate sulfurtransferase
MGISEGSTIVVYGDADSSWGGEGWVLWVLDYLGHKGKLLLLNGGIRAWVKEGFPLN